MANFSRGVFFGAFAAAILAGISGRPWLTALFGALALAALFAFVSSTSEHLIPLASWLYPVSLTKAGGAACFFIIFVFVSAIQTGANLLYFLGSLMTAALLLSALYSWMALRRISVDVSFPRYAFANEKTQAVATVRSRNRFLPTVALRLEGDAGRQGEVRAAAPVLPAGSEASVVFDFSPSQRGSFREVNLEASTAGLVGLTRRRRRLRLSAETVCYPSPAQVELPPRSRRVQEAGRAFASREGEFAGLREWRPGDNPRHIHWRSSARMGRLLTREFVVPRRPEVIIVLDTYGQGGPAFEEAVRRAAGLASAGRRADYQTTLVYYDGAIRTIEDTDGPIPHRILAALADVESQHDCPPAELMRRAFPDGAWPAVIEVGAVEAQTESTEVKAGA